jgi:hypothetical protein
MAMQKTREKMNEIFEGGRYARTKEELFEKAIALLDKCKIEPSRPDQDTPELGPAARTS